MQRKTDDDHSDDVKKACCKCTCDEDGLGGSESYAMPCPPAWVEMGRQPKLKESEAESNGASGLFLDVTK